MNVELIEKMSIFIGSGLLGMLYSYAWKWAEMPKGVSLLSYLFCDTKATTKAILTFCGAVAGVASLDYISSLTLTQLIVAGGSVGLMIPEKVEARNGKVVDGSSTGSNPV